MLYEECDVRDNHSFQLCLCVGPKGLHELCLQEHGSAT